MKSLSPLLLLLLCVNSARAQSEREVGWSFTGQITGVWTGGNAETRTFGLNGAVRHLGAHGEVMFETGGIRTDATRKTRRAVGTEDAWQLESEEHVERTAERYFARARFDRNVSDVSVVFLGVDVLRNTFAGIDQRTLVALGAGTLWLNSEVTRFKTDYGATYTFQSEVVENPFFKGSFPGARVSADLRRMLTSTTRLESVLISDLGFADTNDYRFDFTNSLTVTMSDALSLKPSLQLIWRNQPALTAVALFAPDGAATGTKVSVPLEKLDEFFTLGLVVKL